MVEATGVSLRQLTNVGNDMLFEIRGTASTTETLTIPSSAPITSASRVKVVSANNTTDGTCLGAIAITYDDSTKQFTYTEAGASDEEVKIEFRVVN